MRKGEKKVKQRSRRTETNRKIAFKKKTKTCLRKN